ncbi:hypothetical protein OHD62_15140 [Mesorhizobium sp. YC-39]|uniref:hypothetical protein n=1 Tax=unclassified Mesorhizobium TaxID=325217 RepID=UPI0021E81418|nr:MULTISPECIES: hypothetical protein [unclassified Mesorhizobium]MCV3207977.1 hypothetical protein [Mesorhizobium sp. YC-2]MCV3229704.1 hypothetical protein [Mesorhizobium sp. YC-39]
MARKSLLGWVKTLVLAGALALGTNAASAQYQFCVEHGDLVAHLSEQFQERQYAFGLIGQVAVMEVFVAKSGTWTIVVTDLAGRSCLVAAGDNWENVVAPVATTHDDQNT